MARSSRSATPTSLGDEWAADRAFLEVEGIQSLLELPVVLDGKTAGSVGLDWIVDSATWTDEDLTILGVFGSTFSQILARKRSEQVLERTLADSQTRFAALLDNLPDPVMRVGSHGELLYANPAAERTLLQASDGHLRTVEDALGSLSESFALAFETNEIQTMPTGHGHAGRPPAPGDPRRARARTVGPAPLAPAGELRPDRATAGRGAPDPQRHPRPADRAGQPGAVPVQPRRRRPSSSPATGPSPCSTSTSTGSRT